MKTFYLLLLTLLFTYFTAYPQARDKDETVSLEAIGETFVAGSYAMNQHSENVFTSILPVTIRYKEAPWHLMLVDIPDEKQVLHLSDAQMEEIAAILKAGDGKTHYLEVTNFYDVFSNEEQPVVSQDFVSRMESALKQRRWYKNNAVLMLSATPAGQQQVIKFKLPFPNNERMCRHVKAVHNLKEDYYETTPTDFLKLLTAESAPPSLNVSAN